MSINRLIRLLKFSLITWLLMNLNATPIITLLKIVYVKFRLFHCDDYMYIEDKCYTVATDHSVFQKWASSSIFPKTCFAPFSKIIY